MPFTSTDAEQIALEHYALSATATPLPGELDANFLLTTSDGTQFILKIAHPSRSLELLDFENQMMDHLVRPDRFPKPVSSQTPRVIPSQTGETITTLAGGAFVRLLTYLPGEVLARVPHTPELLWEFGAFLGKLNLSLSGFTHPAMKRELLWDLTKAGEVIKGYSAGLPDPHPSTALEKSSFGSRVTFHSAQDADVLANTQHPEWRDGDELKGDIAQNFSAPVTQSPVLSAVEVKGAGSKDTLLSHFLYRFERYAAPHLPYLPWQVIHNDANDYNVLVENDQISGLLDFGDAIYNPRICELAIGIAYAILDKDDPLTTAFYITSGYNYPNPNPLTEDEIAVLWDLIGARLAVSVAVSSHRALSEPDNEYHQISAAPAWKALAQLAEIDPDFAHFTLRSVCLMRPFNDAISRWFRAHPWDFAALAQTLYPTPTLSISQVEKIRHEQIGFNLSLSYKKPLHIIMGRKQYLYDPDLRAYLDCVNNVCHVGHSHPRVVAALTSQAAWLNTNTRYYHPNIALLAERLTAKMPGDLKVCFFVNSGSEANDLALRLARAYTGRRDMLVLEGAYHGNLISTVDISPYKFNGSGGGGAPNWVHPLPLPCVYRGRLRAGGRDLCEVFVEETELVIQQISNQQTNQRTNQPTNQLSGFISESIIGTGGQVVFPEGYLAAVYERVRAVGGVCIADEVQHGFGRVGTHYWGFEQHGVIPDIVTMGKPFGNGHPLAAVVTTREIAAAFHNGMEYFNTFGGSPVSCAVGLAVMDVIEDEGLQAHALEVGNFWNVGLEELKGRYPLIGDVRGSGLFLGIELVRDQETLEPADVEASEIVERMKEKGILLSTDGPLHNVIKIKPPLVITKNDVTRVIEEMDELFRDLKFVGGEN